MLTQISETYTVFHTEKRNKKLFNRTYLYALFRCDCGSEKQIMIKSVKNNLTRSCGCLRKQNSKKTIKQNGKQYQM